MFWKYCAAAAVVLEPVYTYQQQRCVYRHINGFKSSVNSPMAGIMFTVFRLAVAWRMFSGNSSPLKPQQSQSQSEANENINLKKKDLETLLMILTHQLLALSVPSVSV